MRRGALDGHGMRATCMHAHLLFLQTASAEHEQMLVPSLLVRAVIHTACSAEPRMAPRMLARPSCREPPCCPASPTHHATGFQEGLPCALRPARAHLPLPPHASVQAPVAGPCCSCPCALPSGLPGQIGGSHLALVFKMVRLRGFRIGSEWFLGRSISHISRYPGTFN